MVDKRTKVVYLNGKTILFTGEVVLNCDNGYYLVDLTPNTVIQFKMNDIGGSE